MSGFSAGIPTVQFIGTGASAGEAEEAEADPDALEEEADEDPGVSVGRGCWWCWARYAWWEALRRVCASASSSSLYRTSSD